MDNNVWSRLADEGITQDVIDALTQDGFQILQSPATLLELARNPRADVRARHLHAYASARQVQRLRTEADLESAELVELIRARRPGWLHSTPDHHKLRRLRRKWLTGVYAEARQHPDATFTSAGPDAVRLLIEKQQEEQASLRRGDSTPGIHLPATSHLSGPSLRRLGLPPGEYELWKVQTLYYYSYQLNPADRGDNTTRDWVEAEVDLIRLRREAASFRSLLIEEAKAADLPRNWLRWAADFGQLYMKLSPGNPMDAQLTAYLPDADVFLTADRNLVRLTQLLSREAPSPIADTRRVLWKGSPSTLQSIRGALGGSS